MEDFEEVFPSYPVIGDPHFAFKISEKLEFKQLGRDNPNVNKRKGELLNHQKICVSYLSPETPYSKLVVNHETGTGKTYIASSVAEKYIDRVITPSKHREFSIAGFQQIINDHKAIFISNRTSVIENFKSHLIKMHGYSKKIGLNAGKKYTDYYKIISAGPFTTELSKIKSDSDLKRRYSYRVIIIDEIQTIKEEFGNEIKKKIEKLSKQRKKLISMKETPKIREKLLALNKKLRRAEKNPYLEIMRLLKCDGLVILLLSATLERDKPEQVSQVFNLILPEKNKIKKKEVQSLYYNWKITKDGYRIRLKHENEEEKDDKIFRKYLYPKVSGYVSYMKSSHSPELRILGESFELFSGESSFILIKRSPMQIRQYLNYINVSSLVTGPRTNNKDNKYTTTVYSKDRNASNIVFCDKEGKNWESSTTGLIKYKTSFIEFLLKDAQQMIRGTLTKVNPTIFIENIAKLSQKYSDIIRVVYDNYKDDGRAQFIYSEHVQVGVNVIAELLKVLGYEEFKFKAGAPSKGSAIAGLSPKRRYIIITGEKKLSKTPNERLISAFNEEKNRFGKYIQIVLGSQAASVSINFINVRDIHFVDPSWTPSNNTQVIGRALRQNSLAHLKGSPDYYVNVFHYVSSYKEDYFHEELDKIGLSKKQKENIKNLWEITDDDLEQFEEIRDLKNDEINEVTINDKKEELKEEYKEYLKFPPPDKTLIDEYMYAYIEEKDRDIKPVERAIKESCFDCYLNKYSNFNNAIDGSQGADYDKSSYKCIGYEIDEDSKPLQKLNVEEIDRISSYNRYFLDRYLDDIIPYIVNIFMTHHMLPISKIVEFLDVLGKIKGFDITENIVNNAIWALINSKFRIKDRFGNIYFMKERNGIVFLVDDPTLDVHPLESYYNKNVEIDVGHTINILQESIKGGIELFDQETKNVESYNEFMNILISKQRQIKVGVLELSMTDNTYMNEKRRDYMRSNTFLQSWWTEIDDYYAHHLNQRDTSDSNSGGNILKLRPKQKTRIYSKKDKGPWRKSTAKEDVFFISIYNKKREEEIARKGNPSILGSLLEGKNGSLLFRIIERSSSMELDGRKVKTGVKLGTAPQKGEYIDYLWDLKIRIAFPAQAHDMYSRDKQKAEEIVEETYPKLKGNIDEIKKEKYEIPSKEQDQYMTKFMFYYEWTTLRTTGSKIFREEVERALKEKGLIIKEF